MVFEFIWLIIVAAGVIAVAGLRMDREYQRGVIFRLGRFKQVRGPGLYWIIPAIDQKVVIDIRTATVDIESQETVTRDSVTMAKGITQVLQSKVEGGQND